MEKTSAPDGTLVNEKQQKVKNICKRTLASRYPVYHRIPSSVPFPFHSIDNVQHPLWRDRKKEVDNIVCLGLWMYFCSFLLLYPSVGVAQIRYACPESPLPSVSHICTIESPAARFVWSVCYKQCRDFSVGQSIEFPDSIFFQQPLLFVCPRTTSTRCYQVNSEIIDAWERPKFGKGKIKDTIRGHTLIKRDNSLQNLYY